MTKVSSTEKGLPASCFRSGRMPLAFAQILSLFILTLAVLAFVVSGPVEPFNGWVEDTPLEILGLRVARQVRRCHLAIRRRLAGVPLMKDEKEAREFFTEKIESLRPTHGVILADGRSMLGRLESLENGAATLEYREAGEARVLELSQEDIAWKKRIVYPQVELLPRDVRFLLDYFDMDIYYLPPCLVVSDACFEHVFQTHRLLGELSEEFSSVFGVLAEQESSKLAYVCVYRDERSYLRHTLRKEIGHLECGAGYHSREDDCLFVHYRSESSEGPAGEEDVAGGDVSLCDREIPDDVFLLENPDFSQIAEKFSERTLDEDSKAALRHEGTHQLSFSRRVLSVEEEYEHLWLIEGMAQYCETSPPGLLIPEKLLLLSEAAIAGQLISWQDLVDTPARSGFGVDFSNPHLAYAQSWFLFRSLMQPPHTARFLKYIDRVSHLSPDDMERPRSAVLEESLDVVLIEEFHQINESLRSKLAPRISDAP